MFLYNVDIPSTPNEELGFADLIRYCKLQSEMKQKERHQNLKDGTQLTINMEHNEGLVQMISLCIWVIFRFQPLNR